MTDNNAPAAGMPERIYVCGTGWKGKENLSATACPNTYSHKTEYVRADLCALSTPSEPSITLRELKALAEGMRKDTEQDFKMGLMEFQSRLDFNAALDQIIEAAEKAGG